MHSRARAVIASQYQRRVDIAAAAVLSGIAALSGSATAEATATTTTFTVSAVIASACTVTATPLAFGTYSPSTGAALTGTSNLSVLCTTGSPYTVALNVGSGGGSFTTRTLLNGTYTLNYNLYRDAAYTQVWGDGTGSTYTVAGTGTGLLTAVTIPVYGSIPVGQDKPTGTYTSTITVTLNY